MKASRAMLGVVLGLVFFCQFCSAQDASTSSPTTTPVQAGTAIGQTINAAITAALPAASAIENIIAAIFKKPVGSVSPSTTAKVSAQAVTDAVKKSADPATLASASQTQLTALQGAITEIATVNTLATSAQTANNALTASRALLLASDWDDFKQQWNVAKSNLNKVTSTDPSKLGKISDENVLLVWSRVDAHYTQWISDVDTYSAKKDLLRTLASFDQLSAAIESLARIPGVELEMISAQLQAVKAQPSSGNKAQEPPAATNGALSTFLEETAPQ
jgi:hypothetical protein